MITLPAIEPSSKKETETVSVEVISTSEEAPERKNLNEQNE